MKTRIAALILFLLCLASLAAQQYGHTVLALYKSSDGQTQRENEAFFYLSRPLAALGLTVRYWDVDRGLPREADLGDVRALVSWFRGPSMADPEGYLDFLDASLSAGRKVVVFDNLGAYQNRGTGEYLSPGRLNLTLARLGILYLGDWTDDPGVIRIASRESAMVESGGSQEAASSRFFYRFLQHDRDLQVYLALRRTDRDYEPSPVIVSNANGGFALSRYIYRVEGGKVQMLLDVKRFLQAALFPSAAAERIALLTDRADQTARSTLEYARGVLRRAKLPFQVLGPGELALLLPGDLRCFTAVGLILKTDAGLDPEVLADLQKAGGGVVSLRGGRFNRLGPQLATGAPAGLAGKRGGYRFREGFLFGEGLALAEEKFGWISGSGAPAGDAAVLATGFAGRTALLWSARRGRGRVLVWNWDGFATGGFQGMLLESFLYVRPVGAAVTAGLGVMMIDDWPLPMYNVVKPPLSITDTEFYTRRFWPEIKALFASNSIPFTAYLVFNYNTRTRPPFSGGEFFVAKGDASLAVAREILAGGDQELGFHGYNHVSFTLERTQVNPGAWPSQAAMEESLRIARREWMSLFGEYSLPYAYVPPNNIVSEEGIRALHEVFPSIRVISALRSAGGEETHTVFGPHPEIPGVYLIPRVSSGYVFSPSRRQLIVAAVGGAGVWSHFVHPDDLFDPYRSGGRSWEELKEGLAEMIGFVRTQYPWLRFVSIREARSELARLDGVGVEVRLQGDRLVVRAQPGVLLRVRLNGHSVAGTRGLRVLHRYGVPQALVVETTGPIAELRFSPSR